MTNQTTRPTIKPALSRLLIPGTDADVLQNYATLAERAKVAVFGAFEDDIVTLDVETTGLSYQRDTLIEIAAVRLRGPAVIDRFSTFVDPGRLIPLQITELTSITDADVADAPKALAAIEQLAEFVGDSTVVAHNADFDRNMLRYATKQPFAFIEDNPWLDSIELARIALPRCRSYGLEALSAAFCEERSTHRAIDDAERLAELWRVLLTALTDLPPGLVAYIASIFPDSNWEMRSQIAQVAGSLSGGLATNSQPSNVRFSLVEARRNRMQQRPRQEKQDALELIGGRGSFKPIDTGELEDAFTSEGLLGLMYENFETRQEQTEMAVAIAKAFNTHTHLAVEAGTGVGKSMAYLLPMTLFAKANNVCCGVATKTNTLLDQLLYSELPRLADVLPENLVYEALKGYDHYPCLRKLIGLTRQSERILGHNGITTLAALLAFVCQSSRGDMDHLRVRFDELSRFEVVANADDCLKRRCTYYNSCLLHAARRAATEADIVVTNQALLFCDLDTEGSILPNIRHWVIDEAHGAEDEARDQLSFNVSPKELAQRLDALLSSRGSLMAIKEAALRIPAAMPLVEKIDQTMAESSVLPTICRSFLSDVKALVELADRSSYDRVSLWINEAIRDSGPWADLFSSGASLSRRMAKLNEDCRTIVSFANEFAELTELQADLIGLSSEIASSLETLDLILNGDDPAYVYAADLDRRPEQQSDSLQALRIDVGEVLAESLYPNTLSVIFTSATLASTAEGPRPPSRGAAVSQTKATLASSTAGEAIRAAIEAAGAAASDAPGLAEPQPITPQPPATQPSASFDYFAQTSGLSRLPADSWNSLQLASSYDYDSNMAIYLPTDIPEPNQYGYREALEELLFSVHVALGGSVLSLFTNRREMEDLYNRLRDRIEDAGIQLRCQWSGYSSRRLSDEFLANRELSLFALRSFWQGFDAPGDTLRCVIIPKLPFGSPTDPLASERAIRERDSWKRYSLPEAIIDLRQAAGRLIRSSNDHGALILADSRLLSKWYGPAFINAMPSRQRYTLNTASISQALRDSGL